MEDLQKQKNRRSRQLARFQMSRRRPGYLVEATGYVSIRKSSHPRVLRLELQVLRR